MKTPIDQKMIFRRVPVIAITVIAAFFAGTNGQDIATPLPPHTLSPPTKEFCSSNTLGDDTYLSFFEPCEFIFYDSTVKPDQFSCGGLDDNDAVVIKKQKRKVIWWPDSCVAGGPRCYDLIENPHLSNYTFYENTEYAMDFPSNAKVVSVDCSADFEKAQELADSLPVESMTFVIALFFLSVVACVIVGICCCCGACCDRRRDRRLDSYQMVANKQYHGPPVVATKLNTANTVPAYQAVV
uniref:Uncharacterized protein n=1 Tax=Ditylum brightwellii TaxID=49249 RepID=A0A7S4QJW3_9STRA|mmetsp:Transcript_18631/g.24687  ORF Transcript_18631/g.24687 Transcript_18631/m.24687 type:complete len:240 (-) Transcript_18631:164-883(-)